MSKVLSRVRSHRTELALDGFLDTEYPSEKGAKMFSSFLSREPLGADLPAGGRWVASKGSDWQKRAS